jgi:hypothetical protein
MQARPCTDPARLSQEIVAIDDQVECHDLTRIIHECRREAFETEARRGFSQVRPTEAY